MIPWLAKQPRATEQILTKLSGIGEHIAELASVETASRVADRDTISIHLVVEALSDISRFGVDTTSLLQSIGLTPESLLVPGGRIPATRYAEFWRAIARAIDDEFFGMNSRQMKAGSFAFISRAALGCHDLRAAINQVLEFFTITFDNMRAHLHEEDGLAVVTIEDSARPCRAFTYFTFWLIVHGLSCWLIGRRIQIVAIDLRCAEPPYCDDYQTLFTEELRFLQPEGRLIFDSKFLDQPVRRTAEELKVFLYGAPSNILVKYRNASSFSAEIKQHLRSRLPASPDLEEVANQFKVSQSTLRRRLEAEDTTFQEIKNSIRRDIAIQRLCSTGESVTAIADLIGFADTRSFFRAFKKWTGLNPGEYRNRVKPKTFANVASNSKP